MTNYVTNSSLTSTLSNYVTLAAANVFTETSNTFNNFIKIMGISISSGSSTNNIVIGKVGSSLPLTATSTYDNTILGNNSLLSASTANNNVSIGNYSMNLA